MANQWFKFYGGEYLSDPKIERLSPLERSCWLTLLCLASMGENGVIKYLTIETLLNKSGIQFDPYKPEEWEKALSVLQKFTVMKMIETFADGDIKIINWEKRQEHNLTVAERVAKHRLNKKTKEYVTSDVTSVTTEENRIEQNRIDTKDTSFSIFWENYPKKENKKKAQDIWERKRLGDIIEVIVSFIEKAKKTDRWKKGYIKAPDVFIRNESWEDDLSAYGGAKVNEVYENQNKVNYADKLKDKIIQVK